MASSTNLSTLDVVKAIQSLTAEETRNLVFHLGVPFNELEDIAAERYSCDRRKQHFVQKWIKRDTSACWATLVSGLLQIEQNFLAEKIEATFIPPAQLGTNAPASTLFATTVPASSASAPAPAVQTEAPTRPTLAESPSILQAPVRITSHSNVVPVLEPSTATTIQVAPIPIQSPSMSLTSIQPLSPIHSPSGSLTRAQPLSPTVSQQRVAEVKAFVAHFERLFSYLKSDTRASMCNRESQDKTFVDTFRDHLLDLPVSKKAIHAKFFLDNEDDIINAKTILKLFVILSRYCNYSNYDIILHVIERFCEGLMQRMINYQDSLEKFEMATTVDVYLCAISAHPEGRICEEFTRMVMKINKPASECTLYEIRRLKEFIAENASVHSYCVYTDSMGISSVLLALRIHPACIDAVIGAMTCDFIDTHRLTSVAVTLNDRIGKVLAKYVWPAQISATYALDLFLFGSYVKE